MIDHIILFQSHMESKTITSIQVLESKLHLRKLLKGKPESSYERLISILLNSLNTDLENFDMMANSKGNLDSKIITLKC